MIVSLFVFLCFGLNSSSLRNFSFLSANIKEAVNKDEQLFAKPVNNFLSESPKIALLQENSVVAVAPPSAVDPQVLGTIMGGVNSGELAVDGGNDVFEYIVQEGDTISSIANKYNISAETLLWANELTSKSIISAGQKLIILPVSGVLYYVKAGDTLSDIAQIHQAKVEEIIKFNSLSNEGDIFVGDILIIPNGQMPEKPKPTYYASQIPIGSSYFICPHAPCHITQGLHWYNAIDFANIGESCGKPVFAAAGGQVLKVSYGYNQGAGNYIRILHPNGLITHYGHLQKIFVAVGQNVSQGEMVGLIGYSGRTIPAGPSGCHLHFAVYSSEGNPPRNPFAR